MNIKEFKSILPKNKALLCFDYGEKRLGVAASDLLLMTANPITIIYRSSIAKDIEQIKNIIHEKEIGGIVYGLPLQMDGAEGKTASEVRNFALKINQATNLPYFFWDERLSSRAVESFFIKEADMSRSKRKETLDSSAAAYILQGVLDSLTYL